MPSKIVSVGEAIKAGWAQVRSRPGFWFGLLVTAWVISSLVPHLLRQAVIDSTTIPFREVINNETLTMHEATLATYFWEGVCFLVWLALSTFAGIGVINVALKAIQEGKYRYRDFWVGFTHGWRFFSYLFGSILYALLILVGMALLIFPAIIWGSRYSLWGYFVVEHGMGPIQAFRASAQATMGAKWDILGLWLAASLLNLGGVLLLFVGGFFTAAIYWMAFAYAYQRLVGQTTFADDVKPFLEKKL